MPWPATPCCCHEHHRLSASTVHGFLPLQCNSISPLAKAAWCNPLLFAIRQLQDFKCHLLVATQYERLSATLCCLFKAVTNSHLQKCNATCLQPPSTSGSVQLFAVYSRRLQIPSYKMQCNLLVATQYERLSATLCCLFKAVTSSQLQKCNATCLQPPSTSDSVQLFTVCHCLSTDNYKKPPATCLQPPGTSGLLTQAKNSCCMHVTSTTTSSRMPLSAIGSQISQCLRPTSAGMQ